MGLKYNLLKAVTVGVAYLALVGCEGAVPTKEEQRQKVVSIFKVQSQFYEEHFTYPFEECLRFAKGNPVDAARMSRNGFVEKISVVGTAFRKPIKEGVMARINREHVTVVLNEKNRTCVISSYAIISSTAPLHSFAAQQLIKQGYKNIPNPNKRHKNLIYAKGSEVLSVGGWIATGSYNTSTLIISPM